MAPDFIPPRSRLSMDHHVDAPTPPGWKCYRFFWAGYTSTPYYHNAELRLCTTLDMSSRQLHELPQDLVTHCRSMSYGREMIMFRTDPYEKESRAPLECMEVDHVLRSVYTYANGVVHGDGDIEKYKLWVMYTHNSHLKWSAEGHCAALSIVVTIQADHAFMPGRSLMMLPLENCNTVMSLLDLKGPDGSAHPVCVGIVKDVLERWSWVGVRQTPEHAFWNLRSPDELTTPQRALFHFVSWTIFLRTPYGFLERLERLCHVRDFHFQEEWKPFIEGLRSSWSDLNVVHALILSATTALLNLSGMPGIGGDTIGNVSLNPAISTPSQYGGTITTGNAPLPNHIPDVARTAGIITLFLSLAGILSGVILSTIHIGKTDIGVHVARPYLLNRHLTMIALLLSLPLTFLAWSVLAFAVSVISWLLIGGVVSTDLVSLIIGGASLASIGVLVAYFWDVWSERALEQRREKDGEGFWRYAWTKITGNTKG